MFLAFFWFLVLRGVMVRMNRFVFVEVSYKNMRFFITYNFINVIFSIFIEVSGVRGRLVSGFSGGVDRSGLVGWGLGLLIYVSRRDFG